MIKVMVGLSGGVDSAVAAYLLKKRGYHVEAAFMRNWDSMLNNDVLGNPSNIDDICPQEQDYNDAIKIAKKLEIKLHRVDFVKEYWENVFSYFIEEYKKGRTPNPDVLCNKYIKFDAFLKFALDKGFDFIATGHYAKIKHFNSSINLYKASDKNKDQSYFLSHLNEYQLSKTLFPLSEINKEEVRKIATKLDLEVANKKDSTGICFIGERNFKDFLKNYIPAQKGKIVEENSNKVIGEHDGIMFYTIGQRKGLGIGGIKDYSHGSFFITRKDVKNNILYVTQEDSDYLLYGDYCLVNEVNWINETNLKEFECNAKFRYRQKDNKVKVEVLNDNTLKVTPLEKVKAITPGQIAVFYLDDLCLGGGSILKVFVGEKSIG